MRQGRRRWAATVGPAGDDLSASRFCAGQGCMWCAPCQGRLLDSWCASRARAACWRAHSGERPARGRENFPRVKCRACRESHARASACTGDRVPSHGTVARNESIPASALVVLRSCWADLFQGGERPVPFECFLPVCNDGNTININRDSSSTRPSSLRFGFGWSCAPTGRHGDLGPRAAALQEKSSTAAGEGSPLGCRATPRLPVAPARPPRCSFAPTAHSTSTTMSLKC
jgi:hypothetical protein